jgi:hypothetical protein
MGPRIAPHPDPWANFGNQLFTLMAAVALAEREGGSVVIKPNFLNHYSSRFWNRFIIDLPITTENPDEVVSEVSSSSPGPLPKISSTTKLVELRGYWQSASTLASPEVMWSLINWPPKGLTNCASFLESVRDSNSIGVHLRRGDYLTDPNFIPTAQRNHELVEREIKRWKEKGWKVMIFSDDPGWCRKQYSDLTVVDSGDFLTDFYILSQCSRWFVGSSTFSWWAAFLGALDHPERAFETYYPIPWIVKSPPYTDIAPDHWIPLSS